MRRDDLVSKRRRRGRASTLRETDSPLEGTGFEPSVPRQEQWSMPSSCDQTRDGRTLTLGEGAESSLEGRDIELSVSDTIGIVEVAADRTSIVRPAITPLNSRVSLTSCLE